MRLLTAHKGSVKCASHADSPAMLHRGAHSQGLCYLERDSTDGGLTRGLIYKNVCRSHIKRLHTDETQKVLMDKNILIHNTITINLQCAPPLKASHKAHSCL